MAARLLLLLTVASLLLAEAFTVHSKLSMKQRLRPVIHQSSDNNHDLVARLPILESEYATTTSSESAKLKLSEEIENAKTAAEFGVRAAQLSFYEAFTTQDYEKMSALWSTAADVRCVHPGMSSLEGHDAIMKSWKQIFKQADSFEIQPSRTKIEIAGQTAMCSCMEETPGGGKLECLNVYRREEGSWKMMLHMASPIFTSMVGLQE